VSGSIVCLGMAAIALSVLRSSLLEFGLDLLELGNCESSCPIDRFTFGFERSLTFPEIANDRGQRSSQNQTELHRGLPVGQWIRY
jgi:hypothetical protein